MNLSMKSVKVLLTQLFNRLQLKEENFTPVVAAAEESIEDLRSSVQEVEPSLVLGESLRKEHLPHKDKLKRYMEHCCVRRHYFFVVKKCGSSTCEFCEPPQLPSDTFSTLHALPDPMPGTDGHYKCFSDLYGSTTDESHRLSLQKQSKKKKTLPFASSLRREECKHDASV